MTGSAKAPPRAVLENITVKAADGRVFDLGRPDSRLFRLRVLRYRIQRKIHG